MPLSNMLADLIGDLGEPGILWQVVAIAASSALGWVLARLIRSVTVTGRADTGVLRIGVESFARVLAPLLVVGLLGLSKLILKNYHLHINVLRVAIPLFTSLAVIRIAFYLLRRVFARRGQLGDALVRFEKIFALLVWLGFAVYLTGLWPDLYAYLDNTVVPVGHKKNVSLFDIGQGAVSVVVLMMLALWAGAALDERLMGMAGLHTSLRVVLARLGRAVLILIAVLFSLDRVGLDLTVLSVFGGALGVGLGLGMQRIASNYVSGFVILLERSLSIGDMISVDKYTGKVTNINTRYTVLEGLDGVETVLPNEMLISGPVQNQSLSNRQVRASTRITVAYGTDLAAVTAQLEAVAASCARVLAQPAPGVGLNRFGADGIELELGFWIGDPEGGTGGVVSEANKKIYALVQAGEIKLGYPTIDTRLLDAHIASVVARMTQTEAI